MKTSLKNIAFALTFTLTAFTSYADDKETKKPAGFGTGIYATKQGKINVLVDKTSAGASTTVLLRNSRGETIYRETVEKNQTKFGRILNVDELPADKYYILVISNGETQSKTFELSEQKSERVLALK